MVKSIDSLEERCLMELNVCELCANCNIIKHRLFSEDNLDNDAERLKKFYEP